MDSDVLPECSSQTLSYYYNDYYNAHYNARTRRRWTTKSDLGRNHGDDTPLFWFANWLPEISKQTSCVLPVFSK